MSTAILIPISEYLTTSYRPDREYIDGEVVERGGGEWLHARVEALLAGWFGEQEQSWRIQTAKHWRTRVSSTRVRIPDIVLVGRESQPDVLADPAILIVETLSPDDTYADTQRRADDYLGMGVNTIWIVDPETRTGRVCSGSSWTQAARLEVPGTAIYVDLDALFGTMDQVR